MALIAIVMGGVLVLAVVAGALGVAVRFVPMIIDWIAGYPNFPFWPLAAALLGCTCLLIGWLMLRDQ